jgi:ribosomal protein S18 acetylase RimI-like enzyme
MAEELWIRSATPGDVRAVERLIGQLRAAEGITDPLPDGVVRGYIGERDTEVLIAQTEDDAVVGVLSLRFMREMFHPSGSALVQELVVDEAHREGGVGGALLDRAVALAEEYGVDEISVSTGETNAAARTLYESRGFVTQGVVMERHFGR